jgi:hypothetical protein
MVASSMDIVSRLGWSLLMDGFTNASAKLPSTHFHSHTWASFPSRFSQDRVSDFPRSDCTGEQWALNPCRFQQHRQPYISAKHSSDEATRAPEEPLPGWRDAKQSCGQLNRPARLFGHRPDSHPHTIYIYFIGILITSAPMTSLTLKSRLGLSGWALWQPMHPSVTARSG